MKPAIQFLNEAKQRLGSDYATAKAAGLNHQTISNARKRGRFGFDVARKIAPLIERDPAKMMDAILDHKEAGFASVPLLSMISALGLWVLCKTSSPSFRTC